MTVKEMLLDAIKSQTKQEFHLSCPVGDCTCDKKDLMHCIKDDPVIADCEIIFENPQ